MDNVLLWFFEYINSAIAGMGQESVLTTSINSFNAVLYGHVTSIAENVVMPVAYTVLGLFFVLELYNISLKTEGLGGGSSVAIRMYGMVLVKVAFFKIIMDNTLMIMEAIYDVSVKLTQGMAGTLTSSSAPGGMNMKVITDLVSNMGLMEQLGMLIPTAIVCIAVLVITTFVKVIIALRFIELYVLIAFSSLPVATLPNAELNSIGKNFFKYFTSVCLQGAMIFLVLSFYPFIINSGVLGDMNGALDFFGILGASLGYSLALILAVFSTGKWAKSLCNAS